MILALAEGGRSTPTLIPRLFLLGTVQGAHSAIFDDAVNGSLHLSAARPRTGDPALAVGPSIGGSQELHATVRLGFDASEVLALSTDDEADEARFDLYRLGIVVAPAQRRPIATATTATTCARRERATSRRRRVRAVPAVIATVCPTTLIPVILASGRGTGSRASIGTIAVSRVGAIYKRSVVGSGSLLGSKGSRLRNDVVKAHGSRVDRADRAQIDVAARGRSWKTRTTIARRARRRGRGTGV